MPKPTYTLTFTVTGLSEEKAQELFNRLQGYTEEFADENSDDDMNWDKYAQVKDEKEGE